MTQKKTNLNKVYKFNQPNLDLVFATSVCPSMCQINTALSKNYNRIRALECIKRDGCQTYKDYIKAIEEYGVY